VRRFDRLLADMEACLAEESWLAGEFSLADIGYAPYIRRLQDLQLQFLWDKRPHISGWSERVAQRPGHQHAFDDWPNEAYASLMKEKGGEAQSRIRAILAAT
jgi:glutathione S-transferase